MRTRLIGVYGTLRVGGGNYPMLVPAILHEWTGHRTRTGRLFYYRSRGMFPILDLDQPGSAVVDLFVVDADHPAVERVAQMERGVGYVEREVELATLPITVPVWHMAQDERTGPEVPGGDWIANRW